MSTKNRLITIPISHFCEKARWGLDWAGIPYVEERHLQLFHLLHVFRAARTDTAPVLVTQYEVLSDSTDILKWCDLKAAPERKLYPIDPSQRAQVEGFEDELDEGLGVAGRYWMYTYMLEELPLIRRCAVTHDVPKYELKLLPLVFPLMRKAINRGIGRSKGSRADSLQHVDQAFDRVGRMLSDGRRYLFGPSFTAADLTFAALAASVLVPENYGVRLPALAELPEEMRSQVELWRGHPAGKFALRIFKDHRRAGKMVPPNLDPGQLSPDEVLTPLMDLRRHIRAGFAKLRQIKDTPHARALGIAIGIFFGFSPLFGLKTLLAFGFAWIARASKIAAVISVSLHDLLLPVLPVFLRWEYDLGYWVLNHPHAMPPKIHLHRLELQAWLHWSTLFSVGRPLLVGALILGLLAAGVSYVGALLVFRVATTHDATSAEPET